MKGVIFLFDDACTVQQHDLCNVQGGSGRYDLPFEPLFNEFRNPADMVDMRMCYDQVVNRNRIKTSIIYLFPIGMIQSGSSSFWAPISFLTLLSLNAPTTTVPRPSDTACR